MRDSGLRVHRHHWRLIIAMTASAEWANPIGAAVRRNDPRQPLKRRAQVMREDATTSSELQHDGQLGGVVNDLFGGGQQVDSCSRKSVNELGCQHFVHGVIRPCFPERELASSCRALKHTERQPQRGAGRVDHVRSKTERRRELDE